MNNDTPFSLYSGVRTFRVEALFFLVPRPPKAGAKLLRLKRRRPHCFAVRFRLSRRIIFPPVISFVSEIVRLLFD